MVEELKKAPVNLNAINPGESLIKMRSHRPRISQWLQNKGMMATLSRNEFILMNVVESNLHPQLMGNVEK